MQPSKHWKDDWHVEEEGHGRGEQEVERVDSRGTHALPPAGLHLHAGKVLEVATDFLPQNKNLNCLGSLFTLNLKPKICFMILKRMHFSYIVLYYSNREGTNVLAKAFFSLKHS